MNASKELEKEVLELKKSTYPNAGIMKVKLSKENYELDLELVEIE